MIFRNIFIIQSILRLLTMIFVINDKDNTYYNVYLYSIKSLIEIQQHGCCV